MANEPGQVTQQTNGRTVPQQYFWDPARQGVKDIGTGITTIGKGLGYLFGQDPTFAWEQPQQQVYTQPLLYTDPTIAYENLLKQREQADVKAAQDAYNRQKAAFTGGYSPIAARQMEAAQEAWNRAMNQVASSQGAVSGLGGQSGRDFRTTGTNVNISAQRALTGAGSLPATGVAGMGGVTGVSAADLAAQAGQGANVRGASSQAAMQARAGQMGSLNQLLAGQAAASMQQQAAQQLAREAALEQFLVREQIAAEQEARAAARQGGTDIELHRINVEQQSPFWKREWNSLDKKAKEKLAKEEGVSTEQDYLLKKSAEAWVLSQTAAG